MHQFSLGQDATNLQLNQAPRSKPDFLQFFSEGHELCSQGSHCPSWEPKLFRAQMSDTSLV